MMKKRNGNDELESLRQEVRALTAEIMRDAQKRMELAKQIGDIKSRLGFDVKDEKVEQDMRLMVLSLAKEIGMSQEFALSLLNVLLTESESVQQEAQKRHQQQKDDGGSGGQQKQTHLGIFRLAKQLEASGKKIVHMEVGEPDYAPPAAVGISLAESYRLGQYHYTDTRGIPRLLSAICKKVGRGVSEEQVMVTPGGRFAVFSAIVSLLRAGQELITIEPAWPAYKECADFIGARTKVLRTSIEESWTPDTKQLEEMINPSSRMIVLNYPNNPTGKILDGRTIEKIVSIARDNNLYLLSDEVYSDYAFNRKFSSVLEYNYDRSVVVSSFSKSYAMTGFRVGYAIASKDIIARMAKVQAVGITSVAEPMQHAALAALNQDVSDNVMLMKRRLNFVSAKLKEMPLRFVEPDGAMYVYPELPSGEEDILLVGKLLERGVAIAPGSGFGDYYRGFVRISACQPEEVLEKGLGVMASVLEEQSHAG